MEQFNRNGDKYKGNHHFYTIQNTFTFDVIFILHINRDRMVTQLADIHLKAKIPEKEELHSHIFNNTCAGIQLCTKIHNLFYPIFRNTVN